KATAWCWRKRNDRNRSHNRLPTARFESRIPPKCEGRSCNRRQNATNQFPHANLVAYDLVVHIVDYRLLLSGRTGGLMAKAAAAAAPKTFSDLKGMKLKTVDAMFYLMFGLIAIGLAVGATLR